MTICRRSLWRVLLPLVLLFGAHPPVVLAQVPHTLGYQGYLTNATGIPITATLSMQLKLYTVATGGAAIYSETQSVSIANGVSALIIGTPTAIPGTVR